MRSLWLYFLPLMFAPNPGLEVATGLGTFEFADFLSPIFIFLVLITDKARHKIYISRMIMPFLGFFLVALLSVLVIPFIYEQYENPFRPVVYSLVKLLKFALYGYMGIAVARSISNPENYRKYHYSLMVCGAMTGIGLIASGLIGIYFPYLQTVELYKGENQVSVVMSILLLYTLILYLEGYGDRRWRLLAQVSFVLMLIGQFMSQGRGGWVALLIAFIVYNFYRPIRMRNMTIAAVSVSFGVLLYSLYPPFKKQFDNTFFRDQAYFEKHGIGVGGVDDGGRLFAAKHELQKLVNRPLLGTGFQHRGRVAGLWNTGSHNFFVQILLETGLLGMLTLSYVLFLIFQQGVAVYRVNEGVSLAHKASFIAFIIGGMSGEYFYGGLGLLAFFLTYAPVGSMKIVRQNGQWAPASH